jgi:flagellar biosynthesis protein FliR
MIHRQPLRVLSDLTDSTLLPPRLLLLLRVSVSVLARLFQKISFGLVPFPFPIVPSLLHCYGYLLVLHTTTATTTVDVITIQEEVNQTV